MKCINIEINGIQYQFRGKSEKEAFEGFKQSLSALKQEIKNKKNDGELSTINLFNMNGDVVPVKVNYLHQIKPLAATVEPEVLPNVDLKPTEVSVDELMKQFGIVEPVQEEVAVDIKTLVDKKLENIKNGTIDSRLNFGEIGVTVKSFNKNKVDIIEHSEEGDVPKTITLTKLKSFVKRVVEDEIELNKLINQTTQSINQSNKLTNEQLQQQDIVKEGDVLFNSKSKEYSWLSNFQKLNNPILDKFGNKYYTNES